MVLWCCAIVTYRARDSGIHVVGCGGRWDVMFVDDDPSGRAGQTVENLVGKRLSLSLIAVCLMV